MAIGPRDGDAHNQSGARGNGSKRIEADELDFVLKQAIQPQRGDNATSASYILRAITIPTRKWRARSRNARRAR